MNGGRPCVVGSNLFNVFRRESLVPLFRFCRCLHRLLLILIFVLLQDNQSGEVTAFSCGHSVLPVDLPALTVEAQKGLTKEAAAVFNHVVGNLSQVTSQQNPLLKVDFACPKCIGRFLRFFDV